MATELTRKRTPRTIASGDIAPKLGRAAIERHHPAQTKTARRVALESAVSDMLTHGASDIHRLAEALEAVMSGASPDDAEVLRRALSKCGP